MPKPLSSVDCIAPAITQTKHQLFSPFRVKRWLRLAVVCLLTGEFAGGGGGGPTGNFHLPQTQTKGGNGFIALPHIPWADVLNRLPWILAGAALLVLLVLLWIYISSVYRFVLFDSVLYDRCELKRSWKRWEPCGRSYFYWSLSIIICSAIATGLILGLPLFIAWRAGILRHPGDNLAVLILGGAAMLFLLFTFVVVAGVIALFAKDFCIPIMAMENVGVLDAWRRLLPMLAAEKLPFAGYVLMKIVLAVGNAVIVGIATFMALIALLIPLGIAGVITYFIGKAAGLTLNPATISILVVIGVVLLTGFIYLTGLINTPSMVFFQSYVLHFIGTRYPAVGSVLFPPPPEAPPAPAPDAPPMVDFPAEPAPAE